MYAERGPRETHANTLSIITLQNIVTDVRDERRKQSRIVLMQLVVHFSNSKQTKCIHRFILYVRLFVVVFFANRHSYCSYEYLVAFCILLNVAARSKIFNYMQMSPSIIGEGLQTLGLCSTLMASKQGKIFYRATSAVKWTSGLP